MDIFQTTVTAAQLLYGFISACAEFSHDAKSLARRFDWDLRVLTHLSDYFAQQLPANCGQLSAQDQQLLTTSIMYLGELMNRIHVKRNTIEAKGWLGMQWNRALWVHYKKELKEVQAELNEWTHRFDLRLVGLPPGLRAIMTLDDQGGKNAPRLATKRRIDKYLALPLNERKKIEDGLEVLDTKSITFLSDIPARRMIATYNSKNSIVEYKPHAATLLSNPIKLQEVTETVRELAGALSVIDSTVTGLLQCTGFFHSTEVNNPRFGLIYTPPYSITDTNPLTLKDLLNKKDSGGNRRTAAHPLDQRLNLARHIASAVYFFHAVGWVHKSIRSDNILMLEPKGQDPKASFPYTLGHPYLVNFASAREDQGTTDLSLEQQENEWFLNIYRHPARQGSNISARFTMTHDAYSLGVVLLEIGMWRPLTRAEAEIKGKTPEEVREVLIRMTDRAAIQMGSKFKELIVWCLGLGDRSLGMEEYAAQVLEKLESLAV